MATAFNIQGATPASSASINFGAYQNTTPQAKALNTAASSSPFITPQSKIGSGIASGIGSTLNANANANPPSVSNAFGTSFPTTPGLFATQPSTPLKSQTQTNVDGSSITNTYHPPQTPALPGLGGGSAPTNSDNNSSPNTAILGNANTGGSQNTVVSTTPPAGTANGILPANPPLTQTGQTAAQLSQTSAQGSPTGQAITNTLQNTSAASSPAATAAQQATAQAGLLNPALAANAANAANQYAPMAQSAITNAAPELAGFATGGGGPIGLGRAGAVQNTLSNYLQGLQSAENLSLNPNAQELTAAQQQASAEEAAGNLANTQQANIQSGETSAGNLANTAQSNIQSGLQASGQLTQPSGTFPYVFNPATGAFTSTTGANMTPAQVATAVNNGDMTPDQGDSSLAYMGTSADSQLKSAMQSVNPTFNWNQATGNASIQAALTPAMANATAQLNNLQTTLQNAPTSLQTPIPILNSLLQAVSSATGVGAGNSQSIQSAITDARAAMANALGAANNATPTAYDGYVQTLIPDGANLAQVAAGIQQFNIQMQGKLGAYASPGNTTPTTNTSTNAGDPLNILGS